MNNLALNFDVTKWEDSDYLKEIKKIAAPNLSDFEFQFFIATGKTTKLNPFLREVWAIKSPVHKGVIDIFISLDGHGKVARSHPDYEYHQFDSIYSNDNFGVANGEIYHNYDAITNRGDLIGAYCIVKRKSVDRYTYVTLSLKEYDLKQDLWAENPEAMIKKAAEVEGLRLAFADLFGGTIWEHGTYL